MTAFGGRLVVTACVLVTFGFKYSLAHRHNWQWTWIDGSNTVNAHSKVNVTVGEKQFPGARHGTTAWTDNGGSVWMYGGEGYGGKNLDELWIFDPKTMAWHYAGASAVNKTWPVPCVECASCSHENKAVLFGGVIKRKGISDFHTWVLNMDSRKWVIVTTNVSPPPREKSVYWCDREKGVLWLYGGVYKSKDLDDMWQFSFSSMKWNEIHIPKNSSSPKERFPAISWVKHDHKLYLFGGQSISGLMSDLWVFSTTLKQWKLLRGSSTKHTQAGVYGQRGIPGNLSLPGCRSGASSWNDNRGINLWLFGGRGCDGQTSNDSSVGLLSDLWSFNTSSMKWTWVGGPLRINGEAFYGEKGQPDPKNIPGPREGAMTFRQGNTLWVFGGHGRGKTQQEGSLNDMWVFSDVRNSTPVGPPSSSGGLPGDTIDMPYTQRLMIAFSILTVAMIISLLVCYRKECNIRYWRYKKRSPKVKYKPLKVKMQVPDV